MQKYPEQAFICKIIHNIHTFVHCKMHITMCALRTNYVKEGGDLLTEEKYIVYICTLKLCTACV